MLLRNWVFLTMIWNCMESCAKLSFDVPVQLRAIQLGNWSCYCHQPNACRWGKSTITIGLADALGIRLARNHDCYSRTISLVQSWGLRRQPVVVMLKCCQWRTSNFTLPWCMPIQLLTMLFLPWLTNHLHQGNELGIDRRNLLKRVVDLNDRALQSLDLRSSKRYSTRMVSILPLSFWNYGHSLLGDGYWRLETSLANIVIGYRYDRTVSAGDAGWRCFSIDLERCYQTKLGSDDLQYTCLCTQVHLPISLTDVTLFWQQNCPPSGLHSDRSWLCVTLALKIPWYQDQTCQLLQMW